MFDKKLLLQHLSNKPKTIEEQNQNMGDLHKHLRKNISMQYGISPADPRWNEIGSHADIGNYGRAVYDTFANEINTAHTARSDKSGISDYGANADPSQHMPEAQSAVMELIGDLHHQYHNPRQRTTPTGNTRLDPAQLGRIIDSLGSKIKPKKISEAVVSLNVLTDSMNALTGLNEDWGRDPQGGPFRRTWDERKLWLHPQRDDEGNFVRDDEGNIVHTVEQFKTLKGVTGHPVPAKVFSRAGRVVGKPLSKEFWHLIPTEKPKKKG